MVADEVRALAARVGNSTSEIASLARQVEHRAEAEAISERIREQRELSAQMRESTEAIARAIDDAATRAETTRSTSQEFNSLANELGRAVAHFRT